jgi:hypothetical protein
MVKWKVEHIGGVLRQSDTLALGGERSIPFRTLRPHHFILVLRVEIGCHSMHIKLDGGGAQTGPNSLL